MEESKLEILDEKKNSKNYFNQNQEVLQINLNQQQKIQINNHPQCFLMLLLFF